jgi:hypothetical protein
MNRSITEPCNSTPAESSSPTDSPNPASFAAANTNAFARARVPGAALATTSRTNVCAAGDSDREAQPAITAAAACSPAASSSLQPARSLAVWSLATTTMIRE